MAKKSEIVHQVSWYTGAYIATQFVTVLAAILMRRFLGPLQVGVWSLVQIILSYSEYLTLGVSNAIPREIPFYIGKGMPEKAELIKRNTLSFSMLMSLLGGTGIIIFAVVRRHHISPELFFGLMFAAALTVLQMTNNILISLLRAFKKFTVAGNQMFLSAIVNALLVAFLSYKFRLYGFMWAMCLSFLFNLFFIYRHEKLSFTLRVDFGVIRGLIGFGFSLMVISLVGTFVLTIDRIMISRFLGLEPLGVYSVAVMVAGFLNSFPSSVSVVLLSNISEKFGEREDRHDLCEYLSVSDEVFSVVMPILIGFSWFLIPPLIECVLPKFSAGIPALRFLALSAFFAALSQSYSNFIIVIRKQMGLFAINCALALIAGGMDLLVIKRGYGIVGVALVQIVVSGLNFAALFVLSKHHLRVTKKMFVAGLNIFLRFCGMVLMLLLVEKYVHPVGRVFRCVLQNVVFIAFYIPLLIRLEKRYHLAKIVLAKLGIVGASTGQAVS